MKNEEIEPLLVAIGKSKPQCIWVDPKIPETLIDSDALSVNGLIFRNGGRCNGRAAIPFCEVTPELRTLLRAINT